MTLRKKLPWLVLMACLAATPAPGEECSGNACPRPAGGSRRNPACETVRGELIRIRIEVEAFRARSGRYPRDTPELVAVAGQVAPGVVLDYTGCAPGRFSLEARGTGCDRRFAITGERSAAVQELPLPMGPAVGRRQ